MLYLVLLSCLSLAQAELHHDVNSPPPSPTTIQVWLFRERSPRRTAQREESGNGAGGVVGSYGFTDARGIARQVNYVADHAGFRAQVKTNEPGTANQNPAAVHLVSNAPYAHSGGVAPVLGGLGYGGNGGYGLGNGGYGDMEDMGLDMEDMVLKMQDMVLEMDRSRSWIQWIRRFSWI
ncbi:uncharacterized protein CEXT_780151 [Caerostris extrusa]|uniref:Cuticle protein 16.8 n=1 Tax=Caerostris extrusa TaxID=172846 RepID=A0AAV4S5K7_CAEEX|nr:uncharacterized protein CEXT_780151 [Caerostris extrusa]